MTWVFVGVGAAVGAGAGAAIGSKKGGDDVWKGALIGGALGAGGGYLAAPATAAGGAAAAGGGAGLGATAGTGTAATGTAGLAGAGGATVPGIGAASAMPIAGTTTAVMPGAATVGTGLGATTAGTGTGTAAGMGLGQAGGFGGGAALGGSGQAFGTFGGAQLGATGTSGLAGVGGTTIPGVGTAAATPIAGTTTATIPGTTLSAAGTGGGVFGGAAPATVGQVGAYGAGAGGAGAGAGGAGAGAAPAAGGLSTLEKLGIAGAIVAPAFMTNTGTTTTPEENPMGLASLSPDFKGYEPDRPDPYYKEKYKDYRTYAEGGPVALAAGGDPMSPMSNSIYPQSQQQQTAFSTSPQMPNSMRAAMASDYDARTNPMTGQELPMGYASGGVARYARGAHLSADPGMPSGGVYRDTDPNTATKKADEAALYRMQQAFSKAGLKSSGMPKGALSGLGDISVGPTKAARPQETDDMAGGGIAHYSLGGYSDGGRMLKGPGDGMSDSIPASIGGKQAARLADGEFVVPADVVSHLGNGSTDAGANKLYGMMDKVRKARTGTKKQGKQIKADKYLPK